MLDMQVSENEAALLSIFRQYLHDAHVGDLAKGPPISSVNGERIVDAGHPYFQALRLLVAKQGNSKPEMLHLAHGNVDGKLSLGVTPVRKVYGNGSVTVKVALTRRKQDQIGLGDGPKWAMATGGFAIAGNHESAEDAIQRNTLQKGGVATLKQRFPAVYLITKQPYGVTNEGCAREDGTVLQGNIYGTVGRALLMVETDEEQARLVEHAAGREEETRFFTVEEYGALVETGHHTLDDNESEFLEAIFADTLPSGLERYMLPEG